jgi:hypothetical protein
MAQLATADQTLLHPLEDARHNRTVRQYLEAL